MAHVFEIDDGRLISVTNVDGSSPSGNVEIPNNVTRIGQHAFVDCSSVENITIPASITSIGSELFFGCSSLKNITIPASVTRIDDRAFCLCSSLKNITIPASVVSIGAAIFFGCSSLKNITIPEGVMSIGDGTFLGCLSLKNITIPASVTSIGGRAFLGCFSLKNITIPAGVTSIGDEAFDGCHSLENITIPAGVTSIGDEAFGRCHSLKNITISASVTSIGDCAFKNCTSLERIIVANTDEAGRIKALLPEALHSKVITKEQNRIFQCSIDKYNRIIDSAEAEALTQSLRKPRTTTASGPMSTVINFLNKKDRNQLRLALPKIGRLSVKSKCRSLRPSPTDTGEVMANKIKKLENNIGAAYGEIKNIISYRFGSNVTCSQLHNRLIKLGVFSNNKERAEDYKLSRGSKEKYFSNVLEKHSQLFKKAAGAKTASILAISAHNLAGVEESKGSCP